MPHTYDKEGLGLDNGCGSSKVRTGEKGGIETEKQRLGKGLWAKEERATDRALRPRTLSVRR